MRWVPAVILVLGVVAPALAQEVVFDPAPARACRDASIQGETMPGCIGAAAGVCQQQDGGSTTYGIVQCLAAEAEAWDEMLNEEYRLLRDEARAADDGAGLSRADALCDAQRAWIAFRDADCDLAFALWQDGTVRGPVAAGCHLTRTAQRTLELRDLRRNAEGDL